MSFLIWKLRETALKTSKNISMSMLQCTYLFLQWLSNRYSEWLTSLAHPSSRLVHVTPDSTICFVKRSTVVLVSNIIILYNYIIILYDNTI